MKKPIAYLLVSLSTLLLAHESRAATAAEQYDLAALCGKQVEDDWKQRGQDVPGVFGPNIQVGYENHHNVKLNKCYAAYSFVQKESPDITSERHDLMDFNDHKHLARYAGFVNGKTIECQFLKVACSSKAEWNRLIKPYLED